jgi:hypothetical protein
VDCREQRLAVERLCQRAAAVLHLRRDHRGKCHSTHEAQRSGLRRAGGPLPGPVPPPQVLRPWQCRGRCACAPTAGPCVAPAARSDTACAPPPFP